MGYIPEATLDDRWISTCSSIPGANLATSLSGCSGSLGHHSHWQWARCRTLHADQRAASQMVQCLLWAAAQQFLSDAKGHQPGWFGDELMKRTRIFITHQFLEAYNWNVGSKWRLHRDSHRSIDRFHPELGQNWLLHRFDQFWSIAFHRRHSQPFMAPVPRLWRTYSFADFRDWADAIDDWLVVTGTWLWFFHMLGIIIPID